MLQARAAPPQAWCSRPDPSAVAEAARRTAALQAEVFARSAPLRTAIVRQQLFFPDRRLLQFDCGKLQVKQPCKVLVCRGHKMENAQAFALRYIALMHC